ncbi:MAG: DNA replication/repair protein RecF [Rhodospirillaceae bacterium]|nr:DNA replication/repair protein RecF [Rhodospirillaceae bacterium]
MRVQTISQNLAPSVRRLTLSNFRNYESLRLDLEPAHVALTGANGSGKTNLLEALSFLAPGRGLHRARLSEVDRIEHGRTAASAGAWGVSATVDGALSSTTLGTGRDPSMAGSGGEKRIIRIDGAAVRSQSELLDHIAVSWLTPQMGRLFVDGATQRRRFLDRLVHASDSGHAGRVNSYTHALRQRSRLLRQNRTDAAWHAALEDQIAMTGVAVAAARRALLVRLAPIAEEGFGPFPGAFLAVEGQVEDWLDDRPAIDAEDVFRAELAATRKSSPGEVAAVPGPHRTDLRVAHAVKAMPARLCSTGEQKALLIAIVLAHARLSKLEVGAAPLLLLDEVAAHLDKERRIALYDLLDTLGCQAWLTGTDVALFEPLGARAQMFVVSNGAVTRH